MEHIVQFAISIDDDAIERKVIDCAYNEVVKQLMAEAKRELKVDGRRYYAEESWGDIMNRALREYLDENRDTIIELAASKLSLSYQRSKAFKEAMAKKMEELE